MWLRKPDVTSLAKTPEYRELVATTSCAGKKSCVLVYVTPWCPACVSMTPLLQALQSKMATDSEFGIKMIVGMERNPGDNQEVALRYGKETIIDSDGRIHEMLQVTQYPTLLMVVSDGVIAKKNQDVLNWASGKYFARP